MVALDAALPQREGFALLSWAGRSAHWGRSYCLLQGLLGCWAASLRSPGINRFTATMEQSNPERCPNRPDFLRPRLTERLSIASTTTGFLPGPPAGQAAGYIASQIWLLARVHGSDTAFFHVGESQVMVAVN